jgi:RHS repeat-associated protein
LERILYSKWCDEGGHPEIPAVPEVTYQLDADGNVTEISNSEGSATWGWDEQGRLVSEQIGAGPQMAFSYDARNLLTAETAAGQSRLSKTHNYDAAGRRLSTTQDGQTTYYDWDKASRRTKVTLPNGTFTEYGFDSASRVNDVRFKKPNGQLFERYQYSFDDVGNPMTVTTMNGTYSYGYDTAYRLTNEKRTEFRPYTAEHAYDNLGLGNRTARTVDGVTRSFAYNKADQITGWTEGNKVGEYFYDLEGSIIRRTAKENGDLKDQWDDQYDAAGRLKTSTQSVGGTGSMVNTYVGDQWYRVQETINGETKKFGWNRDELLAEYDEANNLTAAYLNDGLDAPLYKTRFSGNGSVVLGRDFYHQDLNQRVHHLTDSTGEISEKYVFDGHGKRTILDANNNVLSVSAFGNRIGFQGREHEGLSGPALEAGLTFHRNRFYDPGLGRFTSRDPIMYAGGMNLYGFPNANMLAGLDPFGFGDEETWAQAIGSSLWGVGKGFVSLVGGVVKTVGHAAGRVVNTVGYVAQRPFTNDPGVPFHSSEEFFQGTRDSLATGYQFGVDATGSALFQYTGDPLYRDSFIKMENVGRGLENEVKLFQQLPIGEQRELIASGTFQLGVSAGLPVAKGIGLTQVPLTGTPIAQTWLGQTVVGSRYLSAVNSSEAWLVSQTPTLQSIGSILNRDVNSWFPGALGKDVNLSKLFGLGSYGLDSAQMPGAAGIRVPMRLTTHEIETLTKQSGVEWALSYEHGLGKSGGGGQYWLFSGTKGAVETPPTHYLIYHSHPGGTAFASSNDMLLIYYRGKVTGQESSVIVPVGKEPVRFGGKYGKSSPLQPRGNCK